MDCIRCNKPIEDRRRWGPFAICLGCEEEIEENKPPSIADYWQVPRQAQDEIKSYAVEENKKLD